MAYIALYRKYRPIVFEEVVGQDHVTRTLKNQVALGRVAHAYLFNGPRGTGKTSAAKILSRAVNCLDPHDGDPCNECEICKGILDGSIMDVIEIDAASNNSVDNVRDIRDEIVYSPSKAKYKVYIIDEVHMLSTGAFNALLKTLEEPPAHVIFILATTEPHKLPATIISRCQRFDFKKIANNSVLDRLKTVIKDTGAKVDDRAIELIAHLAEGGMRDALSILDQSLSLGKDNVTHEDILSMVGIVDTDILFDMSDAVKSGDVTSAISIIDKVSSEGKDINHFIVRLLGHYRNLLMAKTLKNLDSIVDLSEEGIKRLKESVEAYSQSEITQAIDILSNTLNEVKKSAYSKILLETDIVKLCNSGGGQDISGLLDRIEKLEKAVSEGVKIVSETPKKEVAKVDITPEKKEEPKKAESTHIDDSKPATSVEKVARDISSKWKEILTDLRAKGFTPLKTQYLNDVIIKPFTEKTVIGHVEYKEDIHAKILQEKRLLDELKDSIFKVVGCEIDIRFDAKKIVEKKESEIDKFKEMVAGAGMEGLVNEI